MQCPYCGHGDVSVIDSRESPDAAETRRRRECSKCGKRFTTREHVVGLDIVVIKKNGNKETFSREKIMKGINIACGKRPVTTEQKEVLIDRIEEKIRNLESTEVQSTFIGNLVIKELKKLDKIAYIRFASIYKEFKDLEEFEEEVHKLLEKPLTVQHEKR